MIAPALKSKSDINLFPPLVENCRLDFYSKRCLHILFLLIRSVCNVSWCRGVLVFETHRDLIWLPWWNGLGSTPQNSDLTGTTRRQCDSCPQTPLLTIGPRWKRGRHFGQISRKTSQVHMTRSIACRQRPDTLIRTPPLKATSKTEVGQANKEDKPPARHGTEMDTGSNSIFSAPSKYPTTCHQSADNKTKSRLSQHTVNISQHTVNIQSTYSQHGSIEWRKHCKNI